MGQQLRGRREDDGRDGTCVYTVASADGGGAGERVRVPVGTQVYDRETGELIARSAGLSGALAARGVRRGDALMTLVALESMPCRCSRSR